MNKSHKNNRARLTARERVTAWLMETYGEYSEAEADGLVRMLGEHARDTLARAKRRQKARIDKACRRAIDAARKYGGAKR